MALVYSPVVIMSSVHFSKRVFPNHFFPFEVMKSTVKLNIVQIGNKLELRGLSSTDNFTFSKLFYQKVREVLYHLLAVGAS